MGNGVYINGQYVDNFGGGGFNQGPDLGASNVTKIKYLKLFIFFNNIVYEY